MNRVSPLTRRTALTALAAALVVPPRRSWSQFVPADFPRHAMTLIVPLSAGGPLDVLGRLLAQEYQARSGQPATVDNRTGGAGNIGIDAVRRAAPDGTTLLVIPAGNLTINPTLMASQSYDVERDLAPVARLLVMPSILAVNNDVPAKSFAEFVALAKAQPGKLSYASPGVGTPQHIAGELLKRQAGIDVVHVPYRGAVFTDVIGGRVTMTLQNMGSILPVVRQGQLRGLAVSSASRTSIMPNLPTIAESGLPGFEAISWFGLMAPAGTPASIVGKVYQQAAKIAMEPEMKAKLAQLGLDATSDPPDAFAAIIKADIAKWAKVIKDANIKAAD